MSFELLTNAKKLLRQIYLYQFPKLRARGFSLSQALARTTAWGLGLRGPALKYIQVKVQPTLSWTDVARSHGHVWRVL